MSQIEVSKSIVINRPPADLYDFWHDFENFRLFIGHLESVKHIGNGVTHWTLKNPFGLHLSWDAHITDDIKDKQISWSSLPNSDIVNRGTVFFNKTPGGEGTEVALKIYFELSEFFSNIIETALIDIFTAHQVDHDLQRLKAIMETRQPNDI